MTTTSSPPRKFAAFDIDGTLFRSGLYREVLLELMRRDLIPQKIMKVVTPKMEAWQKRLHDDAFESFEEALIGMFDKEIPRLRVSDFDDAARVVLEKMSDHVYVYTRDLIKRLKGEGYYLIAISGSQEDLVEPFAKKYGFDYWVGQKWARSEEYFTGDIVKTHTGKDLILLGIIDEQNLTIEGSYAVGDSNGDAGMFSIAEHVIAFNPTRELLEKARANGWKVVIERKGVIYELEPTDGSHLLA
jgi:HAD superfamily hydrolase (TIGR01490 family)